MKRTARMGVCVWTLVLCLAATTSTAVAQCGHERWAVKTGTDAGARNVNVTAPKQTTIGDLIVLTPPSPLPTDTRFSPVETTVFVVNATLTDYKMEGGPTGDSDYHLVLRDDAGHTMIVEIPSPACVGTGSPFAAQIAAARAAFDSRFTVSGSFQTANVPVQVTGVGFFDFFHHQHGVAPNVIELHPVLDIAFNTPPPSGPDFAVSLMPMNLAVNQGGSSSATATANALHGFSDSVTFGATGLPSGVTVAVTPTTKASSILSLTASSGASTGTFPVTITAAGGGKTHTASVPLAVNPVSTGTQQWEYQLISAGTAEELATQANTAGGQAWEMVSVVMDSGRTDRYVGYLKRLKRNF